MGLEIAQVTLELELVVLSELPLAAFSINVAITLYYQSSNYIIQYTILVAITLYIICMK